MNKNYARADIQAIAGYVPGEQLSGTVIKLNTNENPYPPSPRVGEAARAFDWESLRLYPDPTALPLRECASRIYGLPRECILCGNGSDDLLTIALRTFVAAGEGFAYPEPSYSLYPVLAQLQGARRHPIALDGDFQLPDDVLRQAGEARLLMLARPNAPTGNSFPKEAIRRLCREFPGVVWIDEAYADFAEDNCLDLVGEFPNVVVSRTFSKSYSLAGLRLGLAFGDAALIAEMNKLKDSYNTDRFAQAMGVAALEDQEYLERSVARVKETRRRTAQALERQGATVLPSQTNFLLVHPARRPARDLFLALRQEGFLVRHFSLPRVEEFLRISIGTEEQMELFLEAMGRLDR